MSTRDDLSSADFDSNIIESLLLEFNWHKTVDMPGLYQVWRNESRTTQEIILPLDPNKGDYRSLLRRAFQILLTEHGSDVERTANLFSIRQKSDGNSSHESLGTDPTSQLREWAHKLADFQAAVDRISAPNVIEFCEKALGEFQALTHNSAATLRAPASLLILGIAHTIIELVGRTATRETLTQADALTTITSSVAAALADADTWLTDGPPSSEEAERRKQAVIDTAAEAQKAVAIRLAEEDTPSTTHGALLGYQDPNVDAKIIFTQVCSFTEDEHTRYSTAYERLKRRIDRDLLRYIFEQIDLLLNAAAEILHQLDKHGIPGGDSAVDDLGRRLRYAVIAMTSAFQIHQDQTYWLVRDKFGKASKEEEELRALFNGLYSGCFGYRWLIELRHTMLHINMEAAALKLTIKMNDEPSVEINMDREWMKESSGVMGKAYKRNELLALKDDPSIIAMAREAYVELSAIQDDIDNILYPETTDDAAIVSELVARFDGREGMYALQLGPGFSRSTRIPPYRQLSPVVLSYAERYSA
ncbi:hypothetical protein ACQP1G_12935 [Nocardia sp. CA-107356]|uniref:hypothetical protein n=1 Tax=Nocardia sp. CA-107356 TaxID=3239972 RepID=UPI003D94B07F